MKPTGILVRLALLTVLILILTGCASSTYRIEHSDGRYFLIFESTPPEGKEPGILQPHVNFSSVEELKNDIQTNAFNREELEQIADFPADELGRIPICDLSSLWDGTFPTSLSVKYVYWTGADYNLMLHSETSGIHGSVYLSTEDYWTKCVDYYQNFESRSSGQLLSKTETADRNATEYLYNSSLNGQRKGIYYTLETTGKTLHIWESYDCNVSTAVPDYVYIYGTSEGRYFQVWLEGFDQRPSTQWLSEFDLTTYEDK